MKRWLESQICVVARFSSLIVSSFLLTGVGFCALRANGKIWRCDPPVMVGSSALGLNNKIFPPSKGMTPFKPKIMKIPKNIWGKPKLEANAYEDAIENVGNIHHCLNTYFFIVGGVITVSLSFQFSTSVELIFFCGLLCFQ